VTDRYGVMLSCWQYSAALRPTFRHLVESVSIVVDAMQRQVQQSSRRRRRQHYVNAAVDHDPTELLADSAAAGLGPATAMTTSRSTTV